MGRVRDAEEVAQRKAKKEAKRAAKQAAREEAADGAPAAAAASTASSASKQAVRAAVAAAKERFASGVRLADQLNPKRPGFLKELRDVWKALPQATKRQLQRDDRSAGAVGADAPDGAAVSEAVAGSMPKAYPFHAEASDHCETSPQAFADVQPLLELLAARLGKKPGELALWDPYFCAGASKRHLSELGFPQVHNECEDFYEVIANGSEPAHDVVVTNPPYSDPPDAAAPHPARLLRYLQDRGTPFMALMPEYCASAAYYRELYAEGSAPLLLCPYRRYHFWTPDGARPGRNEKTHRKKGLGVRNSPFVAMWFVNLAPVVEPRELLRLAKAGNLPGVDVYRPPADDNAENADGAADSSVRCRLCRRIEGLPEGRACFSGGRRASSAAGAGDAGAADAGAADAGAAGKKRRGAAAKAEAEPAAKRQKRAKA
eukprot:TRINITY_DN28895_c0_g1_i1.p1 TRINITY_DN28895_c0_g1~~TRINITY_DN28895_c0_g1_i1.p1  ORF type:complete len:453 (+),score=117.31 TRINITY_DN28895_c0_g1_i1:69-1361(+)